MTGRCWKGAVLPVTVACSVVVVVDCSVTVKFDSIMLAAVKEVFCRLYSSASLSVQAHRGYMIQCRTHNVSFFVTLLVDEAVTLFTIGKVWCSGEFW